MEAAHEQGRAVAPEQIAEQPPRRAAFGAERGLVAQIIEGDFFVGAIDDVGAIGGPARIRFLAVDDQPDRQSEAVINGDRKSTRLNSSHYCASRMPSSA